MAGTAAFPLIILDWDDTVIPTSFITDKSFDPEVLAPVAEDAERFLRTCLSFGQVVLCTNAERGWIESSTAAYFPRLSEVVTQIGILSAQSTFAPLGYGDPYDWKRLAFSRIVSSAPGLRNVLSVGDAWYERAAVYQACRELEWCTAEPVWCKSVKFHPEPDLATLRSQQQLCLQHLPQLLAHAGCLDVFVSASLDQLIGLPETPCLPQVPYFDVGFLTSDGNQDGNQAPFREAITV